MTADAPATLAELGWTEALARQFEPLAREGLVAGRIAVEHRTKYGVYTEGGEAEAALTGNRKLAYEALLAHPLGPSADQVQAVLDDLLETHKAYLPLFWK